LSWNQNDTAATIQRNLSAGTIGEMTDRSYLHQLDPFAIQLTESFGLRWYGLAYIAGFLVAWAAIKWMGKKKITAIEPSRSGDFIFASILGVLIGGRLGYCLFYSPSLLYTFTADFPYWGLLAIQDGGMASHGGIIGVAVAFIIWGRKNNVPVLHLFDIGVLCVTPGLFFGRIANFINGELWGKALPPALQTNPPAWSVKYPSEITTVWLQSPDQFSHKLDQLEPLRTTIVGGNSFHQTIVDEMYAGNQAAVETVQPLLTAWYPSQLFQAIAEGPLLLFVFVLIWWKPKKAGILASTFLLLYGSTRIVTELYRQPDENVALVAGLSRGQLLSVAMVIAGVLMLYCVLKRDSNKYGGFGPINQPTVTPT
jgi:phosphatidylglycerol:prolipoprotein diacylglycerol transferase